MSNIVFVDKDDNVIGAGRKREAYDKGIPHRSIRIFLISSAGQVLFARRADSVKILPGKWGESVAGHVDEGEEYLDAAKREMKEELNMTCELEPIGKFFVDIQDPPRHIVRFNTVYVGRYDGAIDFNRDEVGEVRWMLPSEAMKWMKQSPEEFTPGCIKSFSVFLTQSSK